MKQTFERCADSALETVKAVYSGRGEEYSDSWAIENCRFAFLDSTLAAFGVTFTPEQKRLLQLASLIDVKDSRLGGEWKADSVVDGIAYRSCYLTLREEYEAVKVAPETPLGR